MTDVGQLPNIGPKTSAWLREIGIMTLEDLEDVGVINAYLRLRESRPHQVTRNALWGLQAALLNLPWNELPPDLKRELLTRVAAREGPS